MAESEEGAESRLFVSVIAFVHVFLDDRSLINLRACCKSTVASCLSSVTHLHLRLSSMVAHNVLYDVKLFRRFMSYVDLAFPAAISVSLTPRQNGMDSVDLVVGTNTGLYPLLQLLLRPNLINLVLSGLNSSPTSPLMLSEMEEQEEEDSQQKEEMEIRSGGDQRQGEANVGIDVQEITAHSSSSSSSLRSLTVTNARVPLPLLRARLLPLCPLLSSLYLQDYPWTETELATEGTELALQGLQGLRGLLHSCASLQHLNTLHIDGLYSPSPDSALEVPLKQLSTLWISRCSLRSLELHPQARLVDLRFYDCSSMSVRSFLDCTTQCRHSLRVLSASRCGLSDQVYLPELRLLECLNLSNNHRVSSLVLSGAPSLKALDIQQCFSLTKLVLHGPHRLSELDLRLLIYLEDLQVRGVHFQDNDKDRDAPLYANRELVISPNSSSSIEVVADGSAVASSVFALKMRELAMDVGIL